MEVAGGIGVVGEFVWFVGVEGLRFLVFVVTGVVVGVVVVVVVGAVAQEQAQTLYRSVRARLTASADQTPRHVVVAPPRDPAALSRFSVVASVACRQEQKVQKSTQRHIRSETATNKIDHTSRPAA